MVNASERSMRILMEGGPISITDVERELKIPHNSFIFHVQRLPEIGFIRGRKKRGATKKFYYLTFFYRKLIKNSDKVIGCEIRTNGVTINKFNCNNCNVKFKIFQDCRFKNTTIEDLKELGYSDEIFSKCKKF